MRERSRKTVHQNLKRERKQNQQLHTAAPSAHCSLAQHQAAAGTPDNTVQGRKKTAPIANSTETP